jgi:hypothetical protein
MATSSLLTPFWCTWFTHSRDICHRPRASARIGVHTPDFENFKVINQYNKLLYYPYKYSFMAGGKVKFDSKILSLKSSLLEGRRARRPGLGLDYQLPLSFHP